MKHFAHSLGLQFDSALVKKYERSGPRYTSYPTADRFNEAFTAASYVRAAQRRRVNGLVLPLSLYVHLPFCPTICFYCACNKLVTRDRGKVQRYVKYLAQEIVMQSELLGSDRSVNQLHWGGGTPTFLNRTQMQELMRVIRDRFDLAEDGEYSIEVDPRSVDEDIVWLLRDLKFNRLSLGVQDFDQQVQQAINRIQTEEETARVISAARGFGFKSVSLDLIYGLPRQTAASFGRTLDKVIALDPDRISVYSYAHLPMRFKPQRRINDVELPTAAAKLDILQLVIERLGRAGYVYIGMDHFSKPTDELAVARRLGHLHRNFQGYSTHAECDLVGMGITAIGQIMPSYSQNARTLEQYYDRLDQGILPIMGGVELSWDDRMRRAIIQSLMCHFVVPIESIEVAYLVDFKGYFAPELEDLQQMEQDGLLQLSDQWIEVRPKGRLLIRNICMVFDRYLRADREWLRYSKVI